MLYQKYHWYTSASGKTKYYSAGDKKTANKIAQELRERGYKVSVQKVHTKTIAKHYVIKARKY
jgi:menaquinone-dependent protoporphyrinogen IX oxidase